MCRGNIGNILSHATERAWYGLRTGVQPHAKVIIWDGVISGCFEDAVIFLEEEKRSLLVLGLNSGLQDKVLKAVLMDREYRETVA
jgi:hypothetical protein